MTLRTTFTEFIGVDHPIALAPMGESAGGALAAAVSNGGGLGIVGGGRGEPRWVERELAIVAEATEKPWGIGFLAWAAEVDAVRRSLDHEPSVVMVSFGDPEPIARVVHESSARLIVQVTDLEEARRAVAVGAEVIIAQGGEAGGHGGKRATLPFVPAVVDLVAPTPVLAAGGIADGRGLAAALMLGAAGALIGTRFQVSTQALVDAESVKAILHGHGEDTERSRVLDIARNASWPARYTGRMLRNAFLDRWRGREEELEGDLAARDAYRHARELGDMSVVPVWASEAIDLISESFSATDIVIAMAREAEEAIARVLAPG
jgi:nitronate monooxygenase